MSSQTGETVQFEFPQKLELIDPLAVAEEIYTWTHENTPYTTNGIYRPEEARKLHGGNCYAVAQIIAEQAAERDVSAAILLNKGHARPFVKIGNAVLSIEMSKGSLNKNILALEEEALNTNHGHEASQLINLYNEHVTDRMDSGDFAVYFTNSTPSESAAPTWMAQSTDVIQTKNDLVNSKDAHIIVDAKRGSKILCAIGDLRIARKTKNRGLYRRKMQELGCYVPDFIDIRTIKD